MKTRLAAAITILLLPATAASGQGMRGPSTPRLEPHLAGQPPAVKGEPQSTTDYKAATDKAATATEETDYSGNADRDYVAHMLTQAQASSDIAQVELKYGKDPAMRKLAQGVVDEQVRHIAVLQDWQAHHPPKP